MGIPRDTAQVVGVIALAALVAAVALFGPIIGAIWLFRSAHTDPVETVARDDGYRRNPPGSRTTRATRGYCDSGSLSLDRMFATNSSRAEVFDYYATTLPRDGWASGGTTNDEALAFEKELDGIDATLGIHQWEDEFVVSVSANSAPC